MTQHSHPAYVPGCMRCDLSRAEVEPDQRAQDVEAVADVVAAVLRDDTEAVADLIAAARREGAEQSLRDAAESWPHTGISPVAFWLRDCADAIARGDR